jgi:hypothetical protein
MMTQQLQYRKIPYVNPEQITPLFSASEDLTEILAQSQSIEDFIATLQEKELYFDLVQFLAHALPVREAILWAYLCLEIRMPDWNKTQQTCLASCKQWVFEPSEEGRRRCELYATRLELKCAPSWLAQAVFWNGAGSIVSPELPSVLPDPKLYAKACAGAINTAAAIPEWDKHDDYYQQSIAIALNIANGGLGNS